MQWLYIKWPPLSVCRPGSNEAGVHALSSGMGGLHIASTTGYVPSNQYYATNQTGAATYAQPTYSTPGSWTTANAQVSLKALSDKAT